MPYKQINTDTFSQCSICHKWKHVTDFYRDSSKTKGRMSRCKKCDNHKRTQSRKTDETEQKKQQVRQQTRYLVNTGQIEQGEHCVDCGHTEHLERHHVDYDSPEHFVILCKMCHKKRHY